MKDCLKKITAKVERGLYSRRALWVLAAASFLESIIVPIPLEVVLIPAMQRRREYIWWFAGTALLGCVVGALAGYLLGSLMMDSAGQWLVEAAGSQASFEQAKKTMQEHGFWFVMGVSVIPIPFQIAMVAAGATDYPITPYLLATAISRSIRYFGLAYLVLWLGPKAEQCFREHRYLAAAVLLLLVLGGWGAGQLFKSRG